MARVNEGFRPDDALVERLKHKAEQGEIRDEEIKRLELLKELNKQPPQ